MSHKDVEASALAREYYTDYAKYVLEYRALPSIYDGLKPVQRRIIYIANQQPKKLMKTAKLSGLCLALHPHGSASVDGAINEMACPTNLLPLFSTKGNFGGNGLEAASSRYTECYLSEIARYIFCQFIDYADYEEGELNIKEPVALPSLLPYAFIKGSEGIGIGLATKIIPLDLIDLIDYYIDYIKNDGVSSKKIMPDIGPVKLEMSKKDVYSSVTSCRGKLSASPIVDVRDNTIVFYGVFGSTVDSVLTKFDKKYGYLSSGKAGYMDNTTTETCYCFELYGKSVSEKFKQTFIQDFLSVAKGSKSYCRIVEEDGAAVYASLGTVVSKSLEYLNRAIDRKFSEEKKAISEKLALFNALNLCKKRGVFNEIASLDEGALISKIMTEASCSEDLAKDIIKKPISYLTASHRDEEERLRDELSEIDTHNRKEYLLSMYRELRKMVMPVYKARKHTVWSKEEGSL